MKYTEKTKKRCINVRKLFGDSYLELSLVGRHPYWVEFVKNSDLTEFEKEACIKEFLNTKDIKKRYSKGK